MPTQSPIYIAKAAYELCKDNYGWANNVRSITVQAINLIPQDTPRQIDLFCNFEQMERQEKLDDCIEEIRRRFGKDSIKQGILLQKFKMPSEKAEITMPTGMIG